MLWLRGPRVPYHTMRGFFSAPLTADAQLQQDRCNVALCRSTSQYDAVRRSASRCGVVRRNTSQDVAVRRSTP
eukprot:981071-Alexandrium_andersonii.AAC.1